ncbi:unnamed protein product, partial [Rotaria sp. Silwood2]
FNRRINKSGHSSLLLAFVFHDLLNLDEPIDNEIFLDYLQKLINNYSSESIVFDLLNIYCQKNINQHEKILELLQNDDNQEKLPIKQTNQLLLILKLFPDSISIAETIYKTLVKKAILFFQSSSNENNQ